MQKVIFLDVDGTLVNDNGIVPDSAKHAIQQARNNGHLVFICTGRSKAELFSDILHVGFDGIIGAAGGYIEVGQEVLFHECVKKEDVKELVHFFNKHQIDFYLESNGGLFASHNCKNHILSIIENLLLENPQAKEEVEKGLMPFYETLIEESHMIRDDINKISFLGSSVPLDMISREFSSKFHIIPTTVPVFGENSGECSIPGINKAVAIEKLLNHLKLEREATFAYGDGLNDIEMLQFVQKGIAMGNAKDTVKKIANDVTDTHDEDGIYNSFKKYGLIY